MNEQEDRLYTWLNKSDDFNGEGRPIAYPIGNDIVLDGRFNLCQLQIIVELMKYSQEQE